MLLLYLNKKKKNCWFMEKLVVRNLRKGKYQDAKS